MDTGGAQKHSKSKEAKITHTGETTVTPHESSTETV
jgi:hypothetical protein